MSYKANSNIIKVSTAGVVGANGLIVGNPDTTAKDASAALEIESTTGGLLLPRVTTVQRDAIASPTQGLLVENTTTDRVEVKAFSGWQRVMTEETAAITESQIVNSAVTQEKRSALPYQKSSFINFTITGGSFGLVASVTIQTTGRPVVVMISSEGGVGAVYRLQAAVSTATLGYSTAQFKRNSTTISQFLTGITLPTASLSNRLDIPCGTFFTFDTPPAGTHTYEFFAASGGTNTTLNIVGCVLVAYEL